MQSLHHPTRTHHLWTTPPTDTHRTHTMSLMVRIRSPAGQSRIKVEPGQSAVAFYETVGEVCKVNVRGVCVWSCPHAMRCARVCEQALPLSWTSEVLAHAVCLCCVIGFLDQKVVVTFPCTAPCREVVPLTHVPHSSPCLSVCTPACPWVCMCVCVVCVGDIQTLTHPRWTRGAAL